VILCGNPAETVKPYGWLVIFCQLIPCAAA
jgi:hypothetical protein